MGNATSFTAAIHMSKRVFGERRAAAFPPGRNSFGPEGAKLVEVNGFEPSTPGLQSRCSPAELHPPKHGMVGSGRFELPTSSLSGTRSNQLSYEPTL